MRGARTVGAMLARLRASGIDTDAAEALADRACLADLPVRWNARLRSAAGNCHFSNIGIRRVATLIELNPRLMAEGLHAVAETFLHELAHAVAPDAGHSIKWQLLARSIGSTGERCHEYASMTPERKLIATCATCGAELRKARRPNARKETQFLLGRVTHRRCGGRFNLAYDTTEVK
jgi:predicted SprT family Zn-dependent metalloprotease